MPKAVASRAKSLFGMFEKSYFRRYMLKPVTKATSNDLRAHLELALFYNVDKYPVHKSVVRNHMGHSKLVSQRHFHASSRDALNNLLGHVLPGCTFKRKRIVTCACYLCMLLVHLLVHLLVQLVQLVQLVHVLLLVLV